MSIGVYCTVYRVLVVQYQLLVLRGKLGRALRHLVAASTKIHESISAFLSR